MLHGERDSYVRIRSVRSCGGNFGGSSGSAVEDSKPQRTRNIMRMLVIACAKGALLEMAKGDGGEIFEGSVEGGSASSAATTRGASEGEPHVEAGHVGGLGDGCELVHGELLPQEGET